MILSTKTVQEARKLAAPNGYLMVWHTAARTASRTGRVRDLHDGFESIPETTPGELLELASELRTLSKDLCRVGYDEGYALWVDGKPTVARSTLPVYAGEQSSSLSLAIQLASRLEPGSHRIELGTIRFVRENRLAVVVDVV